MSGTEAVMVCYTLKHITAAHTPKSLSSSYIWAMQYLSKQLLELRPCASLLMFGFPSG